MLERFFITDFEEIYNIMCQSFPRDEFRPREAQRVLFEEEKYQVWGIRENGKIVSIAAIWELDDVLFIEHLATLPEKRSTGLGSVILRALPTVTDKPLCLEVEPPESEITRRRIGFYERNGLCLNLYPYIQPALAPEQSPVPLLIMTSDEKIDEQTFLKVKNQLYKYVYKV